jgi:ATP-dependent Clp protease ATP-binding subunit ClpX
MRKVMRAIGARRRMLRCSFCGRPENEVSRLVGGVSAYICDSCISECVVVLQDNGGFEAPQGTRAH